MHDSDDTEEYQPKVGQCVYIPGHNPFWYERLYRSGWWVHRRPNGLITEIDEDGNVVVELWAQEDNEEVYSIYDFITFAVDGEQKMWMLA